MKIPQACSWIELEEIVEIKGYSQDIHSVPGWKWGTHFNVA